MTSKKLYNDLPSDFRLWVVLNFFDQLFVGHLLPDPVQRIALILWDGGHLPTGPAGRHQGAASAALRADPHGPAVAVTQAVTTWAEDW